LSVASLLRRLSDLPPRRFAAAEETVWVEMADGVRLATRVFRPRGRPQSPGVLLRVLHGAGGRLRPAAALGRMLGEAGYAAAVQDVRGRYDSEGLFEPFAHELADGARAVAWLAEQPWCDGRVGVLGSAYAAYAAWAAACVGAPVRAVVAVMGTADPHRAWHPGGATALELALRFAAATGEREDLSVRQLDLGRALAFRPVREADRVAVRERPWYREGLAHPLRDAWWQARAAGPAAPPPALVVGGWYDPVLPAQMADWRALHVRTPRPGASSEAPGEADAGARGVRDDPSEARGAAAGGAQGEVALAARQAAPAAVPATVDSDAAGHRLVVGPWSSGRSARRSRRPRGAWLFRTAFREAVAFLDRHLDGSEGDPGPRARLWPVAGGGWIEAADWPPPEARREVLHLRSRGRAGVAPADGRLEPEAPDAGEAPDRFAYDPDRPLPSLGGALLAAAGPVDQRPLEAREDVLVYTGAPLAAPLLVAGPVRLVLHVSSSAPDTDFTAKLLRVDADGAALPLCEGVARCRWREGGPEPVWLQPDTAVRLELELGAACARLAPGERLRLHVSSSSLPRFDRNPNTREDPAQAVAGAVARQAVLHDAEHPSALELFVADF